MTNLWIPVLCVVVLIACIIVWPRAIRHDRRVGDEREAAGKPRSAIPLWVAFVIMGVMFLAGTLLLHTR